MKDMHRSLHKMRRMITPDRAEPDHCPLCAQRCEASKLRCKAGQSFFKTAR